MTNVDDLLPKPDELLFDESTGYTTFGLSEETDSIKKSVEIRPFGNWRSYRTAYKTAADNLVKILFENPQPSMGMRALIAPIIYLYRHAMELYLKELIFMAEDYKEWPRDLHHDLKKAITRLAHCLEKYRFSSSERDKEINGYLEKVITEVAEFSESGDEVRYGVSNRGQLTNHHLNILDARQLVVTLSKTFCTLDAIYSVIDDRHQARD